MKHNRIVPVVVKEFRQIGRDRRTLGVLVLVPAFLLIMYGYALDLDVQRLRTAVFDADGSKASREFVQALGLSGHSEQFDIRFHVDDAGALERLILSDDASIGVVIPAGFASDQAAGRTATIQVLVDGVMASTAATAMSYLDAVVQQYALRAASRVHAEAITLPVDYQPRVWYNPELKSNLFLIPGLIAFILMIITVIATSLSIVRERELGSMEQLRVSPLRPAELILGKLIPYALISLLSTVLILVASVLLFDMPIRGSLGHLFLATIIYLFGALGMGLVISTIASSQEVAFLLATVSILLPTFILSGFVFPISNMPLVVQAVTYVVPARYFLVILRDVMLKGVGVEAFGDQLAMLSAFALLMFGVGTMRLRRLMD